MGNRQNEQPNTQLWKVLSRKVKSSCSISIKGCKARSHTQYPLYHAAPQIIVLYCDAGVTDVTGPIKLYFNPHD